MHSIGPSELVLMFIIYLYYNACMYGGGLKEMPCFRTHIKLVRFRNINKKIEYDTYVRTCLFFVNHFLSVVPPKISNF
jgi:hypothetical protein